MERYESWLERARSSLEMARTKFVNYVLYEDMCYQAQQSVEKALKGLLIYYNEEPEFTHNIDRLLKGLSKYTEVPDNIKDAIKLTKYAIETRYPGAYDELTKKEYEESIIIATDCLEWVENKFKENNQEKSLTLCK
jgi:HEPN domain-containing protein